MLGFELVCAFLKVAVSNKTRHCITLKEGDIHCICNKHSCANEQFPSFCHGKSFCSNFSQCKLK